MTAELTDPRTALGFLLSCVASGEALSATEEAEIRRLISEPPARPPDSPAAGAPSAMLAELLRLYDWRFELAEREKDPINVTGPVFRAETQRLLRQYGTEKKAAWEAARRALAGTGAQPSSEPRAKELEEVAASLLSIQVLAASMIDELPEPTEDGLTRIELAAGAALKQVRALLGAAETPASVEKKPEPPAPPPPRPQVTIGEASDGWHVVTATHLDSDKPTTMDTACGRTQVPATQFETTDAARGHTFCIGCLNAWPEPRVMTSAAQPEPT